MSKAASRIFNKSITLNNGVQMPLLGLGTCYCDPEEMERNLRRYYDLGGRLIDTARYYDNEKIIGDAIRKTGINRKDLFLTTKVWYETMDTESATRSIEESMADLQTNYLDSVLIHWPTDNREKRIECWRVLEKYYQQKKVRSIGLSNFHGELLTDFLKEVKVRPTVNQIEIHPMCFRKSEIELNRKEGIALTAYLPLGYFKPEVIGHPTVVALAEKYNRKPAQIILRWIAQQDICVIPKSSKAERIEENMSIGDFEFTPEEIARMNDTAGDVKMCFNNIPMLGLKYDQHTTDKVVPYPQSE